MHITETQIKEAANALETIKKLDAYQVAVANISMKTTLKEAFDNINAFGMDGSGLLDEFKSQLSGLIIRKKVSLREEFLDPIGYEK